MDGDAPMSMAYRGAEAGTARDRLPSNTGRISYNLVC